jgi:hypothetical protein
LAKEIEGVAEELHPMYHIEQMGDYVGDVASALNGLSNTNALSMIPRYGTDEDRVVVVAILKRGYDKFRD